MKWKIRTVWLHCGSVVKKCAECVDLSKAESFSQACKESTYRGRNGPDRKPFICFLRELELGADILGRNHLKAGGLRQNQVGARVLDFHFAGIHLFCLWTSPFIPTNELYLAKLQISFMYDKWGLLFLPKNIKWERFSADLHTSVVGR